jgi:hypothetical protein
MDVKTKYFGANVREIHTVCTLDILCADDGWRVVVRTRGVCMHTSSLGTRVPCCKPTELQWALSGGVLRALRVQHETKKFVLPCVSFSQIILSWISLFSSIDREGACFAAHRGGVCKCKNQRCKVELHA